jgi:hypothetical protein
MVLYCAKKVAVDFQKNSGIIGEITLPTMPLKVF